ncbi:hypothetical protein EMPS_02095 [Entomortierella parvispora]|uniref:MARVEL domain-containing protein n=1 Tax=Entomortierella parvispora TaxID=205924 RepID=A0A9P3H475_9FUNG|nr:hypothetical protein EMPS_02095 [Entomortierella parvispora]
MPRRRDNCCWCIPLRAAAFLGGLFLAAFGAAGCYLFFTHQNFPNETITVEGIQLTPFSSAHAIWFFVAAVSIIAAAVGLFGMGTALAANRPAVKAFEAFYVLSLLTQFALIVWALIWCKQNQSQWDVVCSASQAGLIDTTFIPGFASGWSCQKIYTVGIIVLGVGGFVWLTFNFYMTNRVIHYARELFEEKENRYKVLGEAATKELDREQQIPLNYTNVGGSMADREISQNDQVPVSSYRDEIEYRDYHGGDVYQHPRTSAAEIGGGAYGQGYVPDQHYGHMQQQQQHVAPGFSHRTSAQGLDLVNPYYGEQEVVVPGPITMATTPQHLLHTASSTFPRQDTDQSFTHTNAHKIASPFDDDDTVPAISTVPAPIATYDHDVKVPMPPTPIEASGSGSKSPTGTAAPDSILSPISPRVQSPPGSSNYHANNGGAYPF